MSASTRRADDAVCARAEDGRRRVWAVIPERRKTSGSWGGVAGSTGLCAAGVEMSLIFGLLRSIPRADRTSEGWLAWVWFRAGVFRGEDFGGTEFVPTGRTSVPPAVVIMDSSLEKVDEFMHISRRMRRIALQSAIGGMALSVVGMGLASGGLLAPVAGAVAQEIIDVFAILNALRAAMRPKQLTDFSGATGSAAESVLPQAEASATPVS